MKKIMLFAAACVALAACTKDIDTTTHGEASYFEKGQKVTLSVSAGEQTKVSSELVTSGEDKDKVNFKWQTGDKIKVTVGTESAEFTLSSEAGEATAQFTGTMPGSGTTFSVQYPVGDDPDLSTQIYSSTEAIPHDKMKFTGTGTTTDLTLTAVNSVLRLNLYADATIGKIVVTDKSANPEVSYTLNCEDGVKNNTGDETMPFFIVLPAGNRKFEAKIYGPGETPSLICTRATASEQTFVNGEVLNMPLKYDYPGTDADKITIGSTVWAPVNCGYDATHTCGLLYQWGRKYGQAFEDGTIAPTEMYKSDDTEANKGKFGQYNNNDCNWFSEGVDNTLWNGGTKGTKDPCPEGWRVPTKSELEALITTKNWTTNGGPSGNQTGYLFGTAPNQVFLPAAGSRGYYYGSASNRGIYGYYWSSSVNNNSAWRLSFGGGFARMSDDDRAYGCSVRCVQE